MEKPCVVLLTGAGGDAQGWGNMQVTEAVRDAVIANGYDCRIVVAENRAELEKVLAEGRCSIVWRRSGSLTCWMNCTSPTSDPRRKP